MMVILQKKFHRLDFYNPIPAFVGYERMSFTLTFQMYCWI